MTKKRFQVTRNVNWLNCKLILRDKAIEKIKESPTDVVLKSVKQDIASFNKLERCVNEREEQLSAD